MSGYKFKETFGRKSKVNIDKIMKELKSLKQVTPINIVKFAKNSKSELHKCFTWDNSVAGDKWRLQEARFIISSINIHEENLPEMRAFHSINEVFEDDSDSNTEQVAQKVYFLTTEAVKDEDLRNQVVESIERMLTAASQKLKDFNKLVSAMNK